MAGKSSLEELASVKEKELNQLRLQQAQQLSNTIKGLEQELLKEREQVSLLQADFDYNFSLLSSRDQELSHYEAAFVELQRVINSLMADNSELKVRLDSVCKEMDAGKEAQLQLKTYYQSKMKEVHSRMDSYRRSKQSELDAEHDKVAQFQRELERRLLDLEGDTQAQREQLMADFEQTLKQRDDDYQLRVEQLSSTLLMHESRNHQLERELAHAESAAACVKQELEGVVERGERERQQHKEEVWRLEAEQHRLEDQVRQYEQEAERDHREIRRKEDNFMRKHGELDKRARESEANLKAAKQAHLCVERKLEEQCAELQLLLEQRDGEWHQRELGLQQTIRDKDQLLERAHGELRSCQSSHAQHQKSLSQSLVKKDLEIQALQDTNQGLKCDLQDREKELSLLRDEVSSNLEKIRSLEWTHAQQRLEWEENVRKTERAPYARHQQEIKEIIHAKNKLTAECHEAQAKLKELKKLEEHMQMERDAAIDTLSQHGIPCGDHMTDHVTDHVTQVQTLQTQNKELRSVIKQMRTELEELSVTSEHRESQSNADTMPTLDYVKYMESEVRKLKSENRLLVERLQQTIPQGKPPTPSPSNRKILSSPPNPGVKRQHHSRSNPATPTEQVQDRTHLIALSDTIASLQRDKTEVELACQHWKTHAQKLQSKVKEEQEMVYILKAHSVPQTKLHEKLMQATQVIIALVKEKSLLSAHIDQLAAYTNPSGTHINMRDKSTQLQERSLVSSASVNGGKGRDVEDCLEMESLEQAVDGIVELSLREDNLQHSRLPGRTSQQEVSTDQKTSALRFISPAQSVPTAQSHHLNIDPQQQARPGVLGSWDWKEDESLVSLQFTPTESSMDAAALNQVMDSVEKNFGEISSADGNDRDKGVERRSTPHPHQEPNQQSKGNKNQSEDQSRGNKDQSEAQFRSKDIRLQLVGREVGTQVKPVKNKTAPKSTTVSTASSKHKPKSNSMKVRNYNIKD